MLIHHDDADGPGHHAQMNQNDRPGQIEFIDIPFTIWHEITHITRLLHTIGEWNVYARARN